jgi:hypothetical protein
MIPRTQEWPAWVLIGIFATVVATNAFDYSVLVPQPQLRYEMHRAIVDGTAPSPQRFRILVPWTLDPVIRTASAFTDAEQAFRRTYFAFHLAALTALLLAVYAYARLWFSMDRALVGALIIGSTLHLVLRMGEYWDFSAIPERSWFAPWSLLEPVFVALALVLLARQRLGAAVLVTAIAALNSQASIVVPCIAIASAIADRSSRRDALVLAATWIAATAAARLWIGGLVPPSITLQENLAHLPSSAINLGLFLGPALILAVAGFRRAPAPARLALIAATPFLAGVALLGYWWDVRLLTPLYPLVTPLMLAAIFDVSDPAE